MTTTFLPQPFLIGGHQALDFVNSYATPEGWVFDWLHDGKALITWQAELGYFPETELRELQRATSSAQIDEVATEARSLRDTLREQLPAPERLHSNSRLWRSLNEVLARGSAYNVLRKTEGTSQLIEQERLEQPSQLLVPVAKAIARLITEEDLSRLHACEGSGCSLWFLDQSKARRRRFCSASVCGNRAKVAAFRSRESHGRGRGRS